MKKLLLTFAAFTALAYISCSKDDSSARCSVCTFSQGDVNISESVCEGDNGNAYVQDEDTGIDYDSYISDATESGYECD